MTSLLISALACLLFVAIAFPLVRQVGTKPSSPITSQNNLAEQKLERAHQTNRLLGQELVDSELRLAEVADQLSNSTTHLKSLKTRLADAEANLSATKRRLENIQVESRDASRNFHSTRHELVRTQERLNSVLSKSHTTSGKK